MMPKKGKVFVGTSGWYYEHWKGPFYPGELSKKEYLDFYKNVFMTAELNNTFYHLPSINALIKWYNAVGDNFIYSVKASRYITHVKRLKNVEESLSLFLDRIEILGHKLGPILFQFPPKWQCHLDRLDYFLGCLPRGRRYTFEFRDPSWFNQQVYQMLRYHKIALCIYHLRGYLSPKEVTSDFVYLRLHGPASAYEGNYEKETLQEWAKQIRRWLKNGMDVFCYFDNDQAGYAPQNAITLKNMLQKNERKRKR